MVNDGRLKPRQTSACHVRFSEVDERHSEPDCSKCEEEVEEAVLAQTIRTWRFCRAHCIKILTTL